MFDWLSNVYDDIVEWIKNFFQSLIDFLLDLPIMILDSILDGIASVLDSIPVPDFLSNGLDSLFQALDPSVLYFLDKSSLPQAFAILGTGLIFRLSRKLFTLGQW